MTACAFCGRANDADADYCMDCGKPLGRASSLKAAARNAPAALPAPVVATAPGRAAPAPEAACPFCGAHLGEPQPFCPHCGRRLTAPGSGPCCGRCGAPTAPGANFCGNCGAPMSQTAPGLLRTSASPPRPSGGPIGFVVLDETGNVVERLERPGPDVTIGRQDGDIRFPDDPFLAPFHARISWEQSELVIRDLGSRNGTWVFLEAPHRLLDGDLVLIGSQVIRFRRLGYPGPHAPDADATKRMGSLIPSADIASLTQLRSDGSARDVIQLSPGRDVHVGREQGDWTFPYDPSMSSQHATIRSEDADFVLIDANSRNGVAVAARGDVPLRHGSRVLLGDKLLRIELPGEGVGAR